MSPAEMDALQKSMTEGESALLIAAGMAMFSAIEAGAPQRTLIDRLTTHEKNYTLIGQPKAAAIMSMMIAMVQSTQRR
ncbi:hypothetical protein [Devosia sp. Root436]|uniref:hypothetical protein n=1 Tax=Devosia sp. Root436 TaxID=1736537 RepID=UPI000A6731F7|nr:hypothetical protein [Devosia sp. Root436]